MGQWVQDHLQKQNLANAVRPNDKKRLRSQSGPGGMSWVNAIPTGRDDKWANQMLKQHLRHVLGLPDDCFVDTRLPTELQDCFARLPKTCPICAKHGRDNVPLTADHAMCCSGTGAAGLTHREVHSILFHNLRRSGVNGIAWVPRSGRTGAEGLAGPVRTSASETRRFPAARSHSTSAVRGG